MRRFPFTVALCACLGTDLPARAATANIGSYGAKTCAEVLLRLDEPSARHGITQWALGFVSGANTAMVDTAGTYRDLGDANSDLVVGILRAACAEEPTGSFTRAPGKLFRRALLVRRWPKSP